VDNFFKTWVELFSPEGDDQLFSLTWMWKVGKL